MAKTVTKLVVYPEAAPAAPTPQATGNVQSFPIRKALVRGVLKPAADIALYGLAAVKFTIPTEEDPATRGFTVAVFTAGKRNHDTLLTSDAKALSSAHVVASNATDGLVLKRNTTYLFVLYGDDLPQLPGSVPSGYPAPGVNPFVTPIPGTTIQTQPSGGPVSQGAPGGYVGPNGPATPTGTYPH